MPKRLAAEHRLHANPGCTVWRVTHLLRMHLARSRRTIRASAQWKTEAIPRTRPKALTPTHPPASAAAAGASLRVVTMVAVVKVAHQRQIDGVIGQPACMNGIRREVRLAQRPLLSATY